MLKAFNQGIDRSVTFSQPSSEPFLGSPYDSSMRPSGREGFLAYNPDGPFDISTFQGGDPRRGEIGPDSQVPARLGSVLREAPSTQGSGLLSPHIDLDGWDWNVVPTSTPPLGAGSSPSDSGHSQPWTPGGSGADDCESHSHDIYVPPYLNNEGTLTLDPSEKHPDRTKCYCPYPECSKTCLSTGIQRRLSFTRIAGYKRHFESKHNSVAVKFQCQDCTHTKTRLDKVRSHWRKKHQKDGQTFNPLQVNRTMPDQLRQRLDGQMGLMFPL